MKPTTIVLLLASLSASTQALPTATNAEHAIARSDNEVANEYNNGGYKKRNDNEVANEYNNGGYKKRNDNEVANEYNNGGYK
ncbi:hypothetical protein V8C42DRAFT_334054, partial [Trichoderma barbatum]